MVNFLKRFGISETISAILMIAVGVTILIWPNLLTTLIAVYLIVVGVVKLISG
jgi:uncharacterized membrane protein HdeD (DUF308 family)